MRNVNKKIRVAPFAKIDGFYINYEECKLITGRDQVLWTYWFYINYEECKFKFKECSFSNPACFILTMRNVNKVEYMMFYMKKKVLY